MNGNREYGSDVFSMLMEDKANALDVYNALNNTHFDNPEDVEITTLENFFSLAVRNDASFIVGTDMSFYEHQSTYCPNMPIRNLFYYTNTMEKRLKTARYNLYGKKVLQIPTPHFVVFYNGEENRPAKEVFKLSNLFQSREAEPELELLCTVYNINAEENKDFLEKTKVLSGYSYFIKLVKEKRKKDIALDRAINEAIDQCIREHVLEDFFVSRRNEVRKVIELDYSWESQTEMLKKEYFEEGMEQGMEQGEQYKLISLIVRKMKKGKEPAQIAEELEEDLAAVDSIYKEAEKFAPDYDADKIWEALQQS